MTNTKITTGSNETIAQTGDGIPDDSSAPVEVDDGEVERVRQKLEGNAREKLMDEVREEIELPQKGSA